MARRDARKGRRRARRAGSRHSRDEEEFNGEFEEGEDAAGNEASQFDPVGTVLVVPDKSWGFEAVGRDGHPGICVTCPPADAEAVLVQGRDAATERFQNRASFLVAPSVQNGLTKLTSFHLAPRRFPSRRVRLWSINRRLGKLEPELIAELHRRMRRLFPELDGET